MLIFAMYFVFKLYLMDKIKGFIIILDIIRNKGDMHMKIYAFADESGAMIDHQIVAMKRNGLSGLEIRNVDGTNIANITLDKASEVRKKLDDAGLVTWSIGSPIGKVHLEGLDLAAYLDKFRHVLDIAHILGAGNIRMFSFHLPQGKDPALYKNQVIDHIGQLLAVAEGSGVDLCHENEKGIFGDVASRCLELHQALPGLKGVFDPANYIQCGQDTWEGWQMLSPYIKYLHIKDAMADGKVVPSGHGIGNVGKIVASFVQAGGQAVSIEPHLTVFDGLAKLEENGDMSKIGKYVYASADDAFDAACNALKKLI